MFGVCVVCSALLLFGGGVLLVASMVDVYCLLCVVEDLLLNGVV